MKVYVVYGHWNYDSGDIMSVHQSSKSANTAVERYKSSVEHHDCYWVEERELIEDE